MRNLWNTVVWHHQERWARLIYLCFVAIFPGTLISIALDAIPEDAKWFGGLLMSIQGLAVMVWLYTYLHQRALIPILGVFGGAFIVEYVGATTGFPFGSYTYTTVLSPLIAGTVPAAILFAWLMVIAGAWYSGQLLISTQSRLLRALLTGIIVMVIDLQIEPVATHINNYWVWHDTGPYYGVPTVNFIGWCAVGFILGFMCDPYFMQIRQPGAKIVPLAAVIGLYVLFAAMTMANGYIGATVIACIMCVGTIGLFVRHQRRLSNQL